ncbi:hypothetical protein AHAS_Ahas12G0120400 [Arachis hypogaea]
MATLSTTLIVSFNFFSEPMFSNHFSFHMSGDSNIARCTNSLDARSKLSASLNSKREGMKHLESISNENLHMIKRRALGIVVKLGLEDMVDVVVVGGDTIFEDVEVNGSGAICVAVTPWLDLGVVEEEGEDGKEDSEGEEGEYKC